MKKVLFGIALILFALLLLLANISDSLALLVGAAGLMIAWNGAFREDK